ncbi:MAG: hypothetical protein JXA69_12330, partial [Phycisphaerae bacterium]|nr:hypothetical protein [Phycisphaerae bacterium]
EDTQRAARLLQNALRYNLGWAECTYESSSSGDRYIIVGMKEHGIRPPASAAFGITTGLMTGIYDEKVTGVPVAEARRRALKLIKGVAATHRVNGDPKAGWGDHWQSALWAALAGEAGWMLWDDLDAETRRWLPAVVEYEADRFIRPDYVMPYWNGQGGDTKAEENAWNATVLQLAVAMMPKHPHVPQWKQIGSELMVSAFAKEADMESNETVLDGKPVKAWLEGYNIRDDGALVNHNLIHCDYMTTFSLNLRAFATLSLAGQPVPEAADFNAKVLYTCLVRQEWSSPPYDPPGGTMYIPGKAEVYYPQGTDWSRFRFPVFYKADTYADFLGWDKGWPHRAAEWMRIRAERLLDMQARHEDRRVFADGEFDKYAGREQMACWIFADAFLLRWLADHKAVTQQANWNLP